VPEITSETPVAIYHFTRRNNAQDLILNQHSTTNSRHAKLQ